MENNITIQLTQQEDGRWFGRILDSNDGHGNEIDCLQSTVEEALTSLLEQLRNHGK